MSLCVLKTLIMLVLLASLPQLASASAPEAPPAPAPEAPPVPEPEAPPVPEPEAPPAPAPAALPSIEGPRLPIQGSISHTSRLPPVERKFQVGADFDESILKDKVDLTDWYRIPAWMAGVWTRSEETVAYQLDLTSGNEIRRPQTVKVAETAHFGAQSDRAGDIWHVPLSNRGMGAGGDYYIIALIRFEKPEKESASEFVMRQITTQLFVNPSNNAIVRIFQSESIERYEPQKDGTLKSTASVKFFDADGKPICVQRNESISKRQQEFRVVDLYKGMRVDRAFVDFLRAEGKEQLIPDSLSYLGRTGETDASMKSAAGARSDSGAEARGESGTRSDSGAEARGESGTRSDSAAAARGDSAAGSKGESK